MPIYAYRCAVCGHAKDVLRKISDPVLTVCPACGAAAFQKQVTAAGFQLKGSGWYATDFRGDSKAGKADKDGEAAQPAPAGKSPPEAKGAAAPVASAPGAGSTAGATALPPAKPTASAQSASGAGGGTGSAGGQ